MEQTPGYGVIASSGGMTTPSTSVAGMAGYVAPPPGLPPPDFSSWSLPPPEAPLPQGLPAASQGLSRVGRSIQVRAMVERQAQAQLVQDPRGSCQASPHLTTPWIKLPSLLVKVRKTAGGRGLGSGEARVDLPAALGCKKRQGGSRLIRRVISPPGQHQMFPQPQHLREPCLSRVVSQGPYPVIPHGWPPNTIVRDGRRTLSMCSRSTTSITLPPIRRQSL